MYILHISTIWQYTMYYTTLTAIFEKSAPATSDCTSDSSRNRKPPATQRNCCVVDPAPKVPANVDMPSFRDGFCKIFFLWQLYYYSVTNLYVTMYVCVNCITVLYLIYKCYMAILMLYGNCMQFLRTVSHFCHA